LGYVGLTPTTTAELTAALALIGAIAPAIFLFYILAARRAAITATAAAAAPAGTGAIATIVATTAACRCSATALGVASHFLNAAANTSALASALNSLYGTTHALVAANSFSDTTIGSMHKTDLLSFRVQGQHMCTGHKK